MEYKILKDENQWEQFKQELKKEYHWMAHEINDFNYKPYKFPVIYFYYYSEQNCRDTIHTSMVYMDKCKECLDKIEIHID